jgi:hypothetical protein
MGEYTYSGHNPGVDERAKLAIISDIHERFSGENLDRVPDRGTSFILG